MKHLSAAILAASLLGVAVSAAAPAAPIAPFDSAREVHTGTNSIEEVRWVRRCRFVRIWRYGYLERVWRCHRIWVQPRPYPRYPRYPRYPSYPPPPRYYY